MFDRVRRLFLMAYFRFNGVRCGERFSYGKGCYIHINRAGHLDIGDRVSLNRNVTISTAGAGTVVIGDDVMIGQNTVIVSSNHDYRGNRRRHVPGIVRIGCGVWIGCNCSILPNVTIGNGSVVGAGSVVTKNIPQNVVAAGNPAKIIKEIAPQDEPTNQLGYERITRMNPHAPPWLTRRL